MDYRIVLDPDMEVTAEEFAEAWNDTPECRDVSEAEVGEAGAQQFDLGGGAVVELAAAFGVALASGTIIALAKAVFGELFSQKGVQKQTKIVEIDTPDGYHILIVTIIEGK